MVHMASSWKGRKGSEDANEDARPNIETLSIQKFQTYASFDLEDLGTE